MGDTVEEMASIDAARWGVEIGVEGGWVRVMESFDRENAIERARQEKAKEAESEIDVVAVDEDGLAVGRFSIDAIPES